MDRTRAVLTGCVVASLLWPATTPAQSARSQSALPNNHDIQRLLATRVDTERRNVGIVVGIVSPSERRVVSYGRASLAGDAGLDGDTVFEIGSVTKVLTATLLADMVRRGEVRLTDSVFDYLPPSIEHARDGRTISLVDLATHTSGLPLWPSGVPATRDGAIAMSRYTRAQLLDYLSTFPVPSDVGQKWQYSNVDAGVLGLALGARANSSYEDLLRVRITGPLGMQSTAVVPSERMRSRLAVGYDAERRAAPAWNVPTLAGAGSLHSTANDLLTFLEAFGRNSGPLTDLLPVMLSTRRPGPGIPQALGWWIIPTSPQDEGIVAHDGGTFGFTSALAYDPATRTGVVVLSNTATGVGDLARHLLRPSIPLTLPAGPAPTRTEIQLDPTVFDRLVGRYEPAPGVGFEVSRNADALMIQLPGVPPLRLRAETPRRFFVAENTRITVVFDVDAEGRATALTLSAPTGTTPATRVGAQ
jgi:serine-type D-Ala-D-Ala carboxypeptidase/endopeptidase